MTPRSRLRYVVKAQLAHTADKTVWLDEYELPDELRDGVVSLMATPSVGARFVLDDRARVPISGKISVQVAAINRSCGGMFDILLWNDMARELALSLDRLAYKTLWEQCNVVLMHNPPVHSRELTDRTSVRNGGSWIVHKSIADRCPGLGQVAAVWGRRDQINTIYHGHFDQLTIRWRPILAIQTTVPEDNPHKVDIVGTTFGEVETEDPEGFCIIEVVNE